MVDVDKLSDAELRTKLLEFGFPVMPITGTTRKVMVKKLKLLIENKNKVGSSDGRRSLGRYSSEEESDTEAKQTKKDKLRRVTMAAPISHPPKSAKKLPEPEIPSSSSRKQTRNSTVTTTTRSQRIIKTAQDEFDTGSDSESDILVSSNNYDSAKDVDPSPVKPTLSSSFSRSYSPPKSDNYPASRNISFSSTASPSRHTSFGSTSLASEYAADRLNQIRNRLSLGSPGYERANYSSNESEDKAETPFLSNFTRRLSALSSSKKIDFDGRNELKELDTNGSSPFGAKSYLSSFRSAKRDPIYDYKGGHAQVGGPKNNYISFAVLAGAALFFVLLAVIYLGLRSDTSMVTSGFVTPACLVGDPQSKKGVNCIHEEDAKNAINLLNVLRPELHKRSVAHRCFDQTIKPHMSEAEIVTFCQTNFGIKDVFVIKNDLRNLEIMIFSNPEWGLRVVQHNTNDGTVFQEDSARNMEQVIFNKDSKITSLVIFEPDLPWRCTVYQSLTSIVKTVVVVGAIFLALYLGNLAFKYYRRYERRQKDEVNFLVERIIEILQNVSEEPENNFVVINHVRDMILTVKDRKEKRSSWEKAVKYINENESRIRTEIQSVQGQSFEVWRWIGAPNLNRSGNTTTPEHKYRPGRRIVDVQYLIDNVTKLPHRYFCRSTDVEIVNEIVDGLFSLYLLRCRGCGREHPVCSEEPETELLNVNLACVAGIVSLRLSLYQLNEFCSALRVPGLTKLEYDRYLDEIRDIYEESRTESESSTIKIERKREIFLDNLKRDLTEIETLTREQKDSELWLAERRKRLTASNFGRICKMLDSTSRRATVKELLAPNFAGNAYTRYGQQHESSAVEEFEKMTGKNVAKCGLFVHKDYPYLAATPDGIITEENALIEVKCPYKARNSTVKQAIDSKEITFATISENKLKLKRDDKYYYQVQGQLFVTGREGCYFVVFTPKDIAYEYIERDSKCWEKMLPKLEAFYFDHLLPAILDEIR